MAKKNLTIKIRLSIDDAKATVPDIVMYNLDSVDRIKSDTDEFYQKLSQCIGEILGDKSQPITWRGAFDYSHVTKDNQ